MSLVLPDFLLPSGEPGWKANTNQLSEAASPGLKRLPIVVPEQELSNWCWAATTAAVHTYFQEAWAKPQCEVATTWLGQPCCPPGPDEPSNANNVMFDLQTTLGKNANPPPQARALAFADIVQEIDAKRPVCCQIEWSNGDRHFNVICGYNAGAPDRVIVRDPRYGESDLPYEVFRTSYRGNGRWIASLKTRKA